MGYYWPAIFRDAQNYVRRCDSFQRMGQPSRVDEMNLQAQVVLEPFEKWAIDFIGSFNPPSQEKFHILICTNYVNKWVETKAISKAAKQVVSDFLFEEIFAHYG